MSSVSAGDLKRDFAKSPLGIAGIAIIIGLVTISVIAVITIPVSTFQEWNNPEKWLSYPKVSIPIWVNYFTSEKTPEHKILLPDIFQSNSNNM